MTDTPETVNGVAVPSSVTLEDFTKIVTARAAVATELGDANSAAGLLATTQAWWDALGPFFREEYLMQASGNLLEHFRDLHLYGPAIYSIAGDVDAAASEAAGSPALPPVSERPNVESIESTAPTAEVPAQTKVVVSHAGSFIEIVEADVHAAFEKVAAFFRSVGHQL